MSTLYVDTSALGRVLLAESTGPAIARELGAFDDRVSSRLLGIELRRLASRRGFIDDAEQLLLGVELVPMTDDVLRAAETIDPPNVATLDAIHLATARRLHADDLLDAVMTFDKRLAEGARHHGITVVTPD